MKGFKIGGYSVGYWANTKRWTQTHINEDGKPVCGSKIGNDLWYQWCANGILLDYIECSHCRHWYKKTNKEKIND